MQRFGSYLEEGIITEGVNDPAIFKAVFLAGGPGSGKSFIVGQTALQSLGLKLINSDPAFELKLEKAGLDKGNPNDIYSEKGQLLRIQAKALTSKQMRLSIDQRLGLVIDGTGKDSAKIKKNEWGLKQIGYETAMIYVDTDLETALERNRKRDRSLPDDKVEMMWNMTQASKKFYQRIFGETLYVINNSDGANYQVQVQAVYKRMAEWTKKPPRMPQAKAWITARSKQS